MIQQLGSTHFHSAHSIFRLALSRDDRILAAGFRNDNRVKLWDTSTGEELVQLQAGKKDAILTSLAFSPDGKKLAVGLFLKSIELFDVETGKPVSQYEGSAATFSPDGKHLAIAGEQDVRILEAGSGNMVLSWPYSCAAEQILYSPDGAWLGVACFEGIVYLWDARTGTIVNRFQGERDLVRTLSFTPDSKYAIAPNVYVEDNFHMQSGLKNVHLWELKTGKKIQTWGTHELGASVVEFDPSRSVFYAGYGEGSVFRQHLSPKKRQKIYGHSMAVNDMVLSHDRAKIYSAGEDGIVRCWDLEHEKDCLPVGHRAPVLSVAFSPDGKTLASAGMDHTIHFWDLKTGVPHSEIETTERFIRELDFSLDDRFIVTRGDDAILVWNLGTKQQHCRLAVEDSSYYSNIELSPQGAVLALSADSLIVLGFLDFWDISSCAQVDKLLNREFNTKNICWITDKDMLIIGHEKDSEHNTFQFWNLSESKLINTINLPSINVADIYGEACSPKGSFVATLDAKKSILQLWDPNSGNLKKTIQGPTNPRPGDLTISPNEKLAVSLRENASNLVIWDLEKGVYQTITLDIDSPIESVAFSPDSCLLAGASGDSTIFIWNLPTQNCEK